MKTSCKSFEVFDFKDEAELSEFAARIKTKLENPNAIDKYKFLESVTQGENIPSKEIGNVPSVDVDAMNNDHNGDSAISYTSLEAEEDSSTKRIPELDDVQQSSSAVAVQLPQSRPNKLEPRIVLPGAEGSAAAGAASPSSCKLDCAVPNSSSSVLELDEAVDMVPEADENMCETFPSTSSDIAEDDVVLDGPSSDHCVGGWEMEDEDTSVVFNPDYMIYRDRYCTDSMLTFSGSCIEMKGSTAYGDQEIFDMQWVVDDIIHIRSHWYERIEMAMVKIRLLPKDAQAEDLDMEGTPGIELKFAVTDSGWYKKHEAITSLNVVYKAMWSCMLDTNMENSCREAVPGHTRVFFTRYFPDFDEPFEDVVYPKGDSDAVSISKRDVDLLQPDTFLNDTIIDFYIKYLKNKIKPEEKHRFHFFNSFFFRKLADPDKDTSSASEGRAAFQRVRKWTRKVNIFEKDFVFIPVNFNYHWSLLVMCHLGEVATFQDEGVKELIKVPCILHMDSIKGSHTGLKGLVQSYLWEEWKERQKEASEDISSRFYNLRFVSLELPQQQNSFDCGLFLLHYVELFLEQAPVNFNPFEITWSSNFLNVDWFQPAEASLKRVVIQRLICDLLEDHSREITPATGNDELCAFNCQNTNINKGTAPDFLSVKCNPWKASHRNVFSSQADQGIEISLLTSPSLKGSQCVSDPSLALRDFLEPGLFFDARYPAFNRREAFDEFKSPVTPTEEEVEAGEQFVYSPSRETGPHQLAGITPEISALRYSPGDFRVGTSWNSKISGHQTGDNDIKSSPETSISGCDDSVEEVDNDNSQVDTNLSFEVKIDKPRSPPLTEMLTEHVDILNVNANGNDPIISMENIPVFSSRYSVMQENGCVSFEDSSDLESDVQRAAKKMRLSPPLEGEGRLTSSFSEDLHL